MDLNSIVSLTGFFGCWVTAIVTIWKLAGAAQNNFSEKSKSHVAGWLLESRSLRPALGWAATLQSVFESTFGTRQLSLKCLRRSFSASCAFLLLIILFWAAIRPHEAAVSLTQGSAYVRLMMAATMLAVFNFLPDYLSIAQTRYSIVAFERCRSISCSVGILLINFLLALAIGAAAFVSIMMILGSEISDLATGFWYVILPLRPHAPGVVPLGAFFYTTLLTSIGLWLFVLASVALRSAILLDALQERLPSLIDVQSKPYTALGVVSMALVSCGFIIFGVLLVITHEA